MKIETLFPTSLLFNNIDRSITQEENNKLDFYKLKTINNIGNIRTHSTNVLENDFPDIRKFIENTISKYIEHIIVPENNLQFYITQSWLNYNSHGSYHHSHNHSNSIISGVFYFKADPNVDCIVFDKGYQDTILIKPKTCNWYNSKSWTFPVKTGDLILFPSTLNHSVPIKQNNNIRISLAFNVFAKGVFGDEFSLNMLNL